MQCLTHSDRSNVPQQVAGTVMAVGMTVAGESIEATTYSVLSLTGSGIAARVTAHSAVSGRPRQCIVACSLWA